jgi:hypothetical protein
MLIRRSSLRREFSSLLFVGLLQVALVAGGYFRGRAIAFALGTVGDGPQARKPASEQQGIPPPDEQPGEEAPSQDRAELLRAATAGARAEVEAAASAVGSPDPQALAEALHVELGAAPAESEDSTGPSLEPLGDLDGDGNPEYVYRWTGPIQQVAGQTAAPSDGAWDLFLLAWDGARWRVSELLPGEGLYDLRVLPRLGDSPGLAVIEGLGQEPFPVVFRFQSHLAKLAWDSRDEESRYQAFAAGEVAFRDAGPQAPLEMVVTGKADPGLVHFPRAGSRGFGIATLYIWDGKAFVPKKTVYSAGEDYTLYRFVSALHLKDFRAAFDLIDPPRFLKSKDASLETFRKYIETTLPEFLGNNIFEVPETIEENQDQFGFELTLDDQRYTYHPTYSNDGKFLLTGLERRKEK